MTPRRRAVQGEFRFRSWGGPRPGAGRKPAGPKAGVPHAPRPPLAARHPVHLTLRVRPGIPDLRREGRVRVLREALRAGAIRPGFRLVHWSIQRNHLHLIAEAAGREALARGTQGLAVRLARALNRSLGRRGRVYADRYHARVLRTPREVRAALAYVLNNHRRHGLGLPDEGIDPCSTGPWFDGWRGLARVPSEHPGSRADPSPVTRPRTWLLAVGWRRHGRIPREEVPGRG